MSELAQRIKDLFLELLPADGATIGNSSLRQLITSKLAAEGITVSEDDYWQTHAQLVENGAVLTGKGRGGSVRLADAKPESFGLASPIVAPEDAAEKKPKTQTLKPPVARGKAADAEAAQVLSYRHLDKRKNNPEVGMVTPSTDPDAGKTRWAYDPHLDPELNFDPQRARIEQLIDDALASGDQEQMRAALEQLKKAQSPYLNWAGKAERTSFEVDTVSLHVHERIDPASILSAVRKRMKAEGKSKGMERAIQPGLFDAPFESLPLRDAIDFYRHERGWANRLIAGDSLLVMNSLLQKESMAGRIQMFYFDPPYGIKYGSNFQPFFDKRDLSDSDKDEDLTQEPEMIKAFRDTWELGIHSYLTYLRDRLLLARELLHESGSVFVQISDDNVHHVRELMDELFGKENHVCLISFRKTGGTTAERLSTTVDFIVWYAKDIKKLKYNPLYNEKVSGGQGAQEYKQLQLPSGARRNMTTDEILGVSSLPQNSRVLTTASVVSDGTRTNTSDPFEFNGFTFEIPKNKNWKTSVNGMRRLCKAGRIDVRPGHRIYRRYMDDFPVSDINSVWMDVRGALDRRYVVETSFRVVERCMLMTTDPGDLVLDPTCGSGTTAFVGEKWGRRWITCDTSRVAATLAKQRLMTASFDYFELKYPHEGLKGGFIYKTVPHVTLKSIANNSDIDSIYERMHPAIEAALEWLNRELKNNAAPPLKVTDGGRKGDLLSFARGAELLEWEVPFEWPETWPEEAIHAFEDFHKQRIRMQQQMDASIASHADQEVLYDQPAVAKNKLRITGPFTVEAVPFPSVKSLDEASGPDEADASIARTGESGRQHQWLAELQKTGIRGKGGQILKLAELEPLPYDKDMQSLHATGHLDTGERVVVSFGPEHAALEQRQVANALNEAGNLFPVPKMIVFCAFTFDPEAAKDIDAIKGITALKAQMNTDLLTEDLKKSQRSNQSFWLMGQPDVEVRQLKDGRYEVEVHGFDYFDTTKGELVSGGKGKIAMWGLDTDYDERSLFPHQVFFPMAGKGEGWEKLKKNIRAELDESRLDQFHGTVSLPFDAGDNRKIAVKIVDDRGIESLKVMTLN